MLKKAGIVAAVAAVGLLSMSPLAFAGGREFDDNGTKQVNEGDENYALVNVSGNNVVVPVAVCQNHVPVNVLGIQVPFSDNDPTTPIGGALGLFAEDVEQENEFSADNSKECEPEGTAGDTQVNDKD